MNWAQKLKKKNGKIKTLAFLMIHGLFFFLIMILILKSIFSSIVKHGLIIQNGVEGNQRKGLTPVFVSIHTRSK